MSYFSLQIVLITIGFSLGLAGFLYAYIIRHHPFQRTWLEVVFGVGGTLFFLGIAQYVIFLYYGVLDILGWSIGLPVICFGVSGVSQIYFQERKRHEEQKNAKYTKREFNEV